MGPKGGSKKTAVDRQRSLKRRQQNLPVVQPDLQLAKRIFYGLFLTAWGIGGIPTVIPKKSHQQQLTAQTDIAPDQKCHLVCPYSCSTLQGLCCRNFTFCRKEKTHFFGVQFGAWVSGFLNPEPFCIHGARFIQHKQSRTATWVLAFETGWTLRHLEISLPFLGNESCKLVVVSRRYTRALC